MKDDMINIKKAWIPYERFTTERLRADEATALLEHLNRVVDEYWNDPHRAEQPRLSCHEKAIGHHQEAARAFLSSQGVK